MRDLEVPLTFLPVVGHEASGAEEARRWLDRLTLLAYLALLGLNTNDAIVVEPSLPISIASAARSRAAPSERFFG